MPGEEGPGPEVEQALVKGAAGVAEAEGSR